MELLLLGIVGLLVTGAVVGNSVAKSRAYVVARKRLRSAPQELVDGALVTLIGKVRAIETHPAPISGRPCVAVHVKAFMGPTWLTRFAMTRFILETPHGEIFVERVDEAGLALPAQRIRPRYEISHRYLVPLGRTLAEASCATFEETIVEVGATVAVYGVVATELAPPSGEVGFRDSNRVVCLRGTPTVQLTIGRV
ncbi:MAG: hypothetical protein NT062_31820 [Proteobacteria bacterium]|nr:hypothetical protein [Pseudomonadota bacterium]